MSYVTKSRSWRDAGNDVVTYVRSNRDIDDRTMLGRVQAVHNTVWSGASKTEFASVLRKFRPDVVHVHNTFATISPSIYFACKEANVPVVQTLHNYRLICPAATLFRNGKFCQECVGHSAFRGALHGCYHRSRGQTAVVSAMLETHKLLGTWQNLIHTYIALTAFAREEFIGEAYRLRRSSLSRTSSMLILASNRVWVTTRCSSVDSPRKRAFRR